MNLLLHISAVAMASSSRLQCWEPHDYQNTPEFSNNNNNNYNYNNRSVPPHPRLRLTDAGLHKLNETIQRDRTAHEYFIGLNVFGLELLDQPVVDCGPGADMLGSARTVLIREYTLGLLWRLTGRTQFADRAVQELLHVTTNCSSWDPFGLVLSEMTHAVAIGYDWLYSYISKTDRDIIVSGVAKLGFQEAIRQYQQKVFWTNCTFNWGIVVNGGLTVGGLGFMDEPSVAESTRKVLSLAKVGIQCPFSSFAPHGAWHEGPMYWQYVAEYAQALTESLQSVWGEDGGLSATTGFNETALFRLHLNGPSQTPFDFGDSTVSINNSAASYFMGYVSLSTMNPSLKAVCAYEGRRLARIIGSSAYNDFKGKDFVGNAHTQKYDCTLINCALLLINYSPLGRYEDLLEQSTARVFKLSAFGWDGRDAIGVFRSSWSSDASGTTGKEAWLAFKAANGVPNHNDLDGGTFVFEIGGQRWASDLGGENYQLPGYWIQTRTQRYKYYRKSTAGHNTITFNNNGFDWGACGQDPEMSGITEITLFKHFPNVTNSSPAYAIVDLSAAYADNLGEGSSVQRGFSFTPGYKDLFIVDEIDLSKSSASIPDNVTWTMHTLADILLNGNSAVLSLNDANLHAEVVEPFGAVFGEKKIVLQPPQKPVDGMKKIMVQSQLPNQVQNKTFRIIIRLSLNKKATSFKVMPLSKWNVDGPLLKKIG